MLCSKNGGGGELSREGGEGGAGGEGSQEQLMTLLGLELLRDLAEDRQCIASLSPLGMLSLARALQGGGKLAAWRWGSSVVGSRGSCIQRYGLGTVGPLTHEALMANVRLLLPSLDGGLCAKKVQLLSGDHTGSNRPVGVLKHNNKGQVWAGGIGEGGTNPW